MVDLVQEELDKLFENTMKSHWHEVEKMYEKSPAARTAKITKSDETALHVAISDGQTGPAVALIGLVGPKELAIRNWAGDTALHFAAALGDLEVCKHLVTQHPDGIRDRNNNGESPIFLAALHGKKEAFLWLHSFNQDEEHLKRNDGDTILHVVIAGGYFSLAINITKYYPGFVNSMNTNGLSPLHILASKTNAFRSSTSLGLFDRILYECAVVDELEEPQINIGEYRKSAKGKRVTSSLNYPENYWLCVNVFLIPKMIITKTLENKKWVKFLRDKWNNRSPWSDRHRNSSTDVETPNQISSQNKKDKKKVETKVTNPLQVSILSQGLKIPTSNEGRFFPPNYDMFVLFVMTILKVLLIVLGVGISRVKEMRRMKELHLRVKLVLDELVKHTNYYKSYGNTGMEPKLIKAGSDMGQSFAEEIPQLAELEDEKNTTTRIDHTETETPPGKSDPSKAHVVNGSDQGHKSAVKHETAILIAARNGVTEIVEKILDEYPVAIQDLDSDGKNVVLLAVENRQPLVYNLLMDRKILKESVFRQVDNKGNSALHLAAQLGKHKPWLIPGSALQMQWEIKWYEYVRDSMPPNFFPLYNSEGESPNDVFEQTHESLTKDGSEWLTKTSESCSVVAALVATVAFTTSSTVPGGVRSDDSGSPTLDDEPAFNAFAISALVALCFSITALVFFLSILTSRYQEKDFAADLPRKLLLGLTSLFASIASMLVSFCAGHIFVLNRHLRFVAYPLYAALCFPITFFGLAQLSLYFDLISAIMKKVPQRSYRTFHH